MEVKKFSFVYLLIAVPCLQVAVFFFYVNFSAILLAFTNADGSWGLGSIKSVIDMLATGQDRLGFDFYEMLGKSVFEWVRGQAITLATILTCFVLTKHMIGSKVFRLIYHIPGLVGGVVMSTVMKEMYMRGGLIWELVVNGFNMQLAPQALRDGLLAHVSTAWPTLMIHSTITGLAGGGMIMAGAFMKIPEEIFESARIEGCGFFREAFQIAFPCVWPTYSTLCIFSLCGIFTGDFGAYLYSNGSGANGLVSIGFYLYRYQVTISQVPDPTYLYGYISAFGILITAITIPIALGGRRLLEKFQDPVEF